MQDSDQRPAPNRRPILKSMSILYVTDICTPDLCPLFKFSKGHPILKYRNVCPFSNSQICIQFSNLWAFLTFSNQNPMTPLTKVLTLTNKLTIDLRNWKGH